MSDRYNGLIVSLDKDIRDDDAELIINAIKAIRGVNGVAGNVATPDSYIAEVRATGKVTEKLYGLIKELNNQK